MIIGLISFLFMVSFLFTLKHLVLRKEQPLT
ncbi:MAG: hypothetical protein K0S39_5532 [Paenibacillus sp.]|jgi:hypothetical protein|nr:hypothetical protein [Paenibacillus sp.]